jgi:hypothetical protein
MTATAATSAPALSPDQLGELLGLVGHSDSVELKLSVPDTERRSTVAALGMDPLQAQIRQVSFFDTPDLALNKVGVVVRARRIQGNPGDTVVKLRPVVPEQLPKSLRKSSSFGVEVDAMPGGFVCSGSMKVEIDAEHATKAFAGKRPLQKILTKEQRAFFAEHAPLDLDLADLTKLGPITVLKLKFTPPDYGRRLVAELWFYPDGSRILELSTKAKPDEAFEVAAATKAFLGAKGIDLTAEQQTKTKTALEFFSRELTAS